VAIEDWKDNHAKDENSQGDEEAISRHSHGQSEAPWGWDKPPSFADEQKAPPQFARHASTG
jgi:hypothetical protein